MIWGYDDDYDRFLREIEIINKWEPRVGKANTTSEGMKMLNW